MILQKLFEPITIKGLNVKNRIIMPPMHNNLGSMEEGISDKAIDFFSARAKGGFGMIGIGVIDTYYVPGASSRNAFYLENEKHVEKHARVVEEIKKYGCIAYAQIGVRRIWNVKQLHRLPKLSTIPESQIMAMVESLIKTALRVKNAGYDALSLLGIGGGAISIFLSQVLNDRTDKWGGDIERRLQFPLEALKGIRAAVGKDYPLFIRMHGAEFLPGGYHFDTAKIIAKRLQEAGIDLFNVSGGSHATSVPQLTPDVPRGTYAFLAREIKEAVSVPVAASNRINHPVVAENVLQKGWADMISVARGALADADWANKAKEGLFDDIRLCLGCNECLDAVVIHEQPIRCTVNPRAGFGLEIQPLDKTNKAKKVLVIGGGCVGLQAAITCAERGHQVHLFEEKPFLGGRWRLAAVPPGRAELLNFTMWLFRRAKELGVDFRINMKADSETIKTLNADVIIVCTGSKPLRPKIPGAELPNVVFADQVLDSSVGVGERAVVIGGGGVGVETALYLARRWSLSPESLSFLMEHDGLDGERAEYLANRGHKVTLVEQLDTIGYGLGPGTKWVLLKELKHANVSVLSSAPVTEIRKTEVVVRNGNGEQFLEVDTVVLATGSVLDTSVYDAVRSLAPEVYFPGKGKTVGHTIEALSDAFQIALSI